MQFEQFKRNHPRACSQGSTSPEEGKSQGENTCNSLLGNRAFFYAFPNKRERRRKNIRLGTDRSLLFLHTEALLKFSISKYGPAHSHLQAPQQEPEVGEASAGVAHLGKQAESVSTFCPLIKKKNKCIQLPQPIASLREWQTQNCTNQIDKQLV